MIPTLRRLDFLASYPEPVPECVKLSLERDGLDFLRLTLNLETIYDIALSAEFGKLNRVLLLKLSKPRLKLVR